MQNLSSVTGVCTDITFDECLSYVQKQYLREEGLGDERRLQRKLIAFRKNLS